MAENSPPAIVVGTLTWRTEGAVISGATPWWTRIVSMPSTVRTLLARQSCTALAPSVIEPPPTVTIRSALAARACSLAAITAARGVCAGIASKVPTQREPIARRIFSISSVWRFSVPLTIRKARLVPRRSICSMIASCAGRPNTTSSMAPNTTRPLCIALVLPELVALAAFEGRLAEEIHGVMSQDDATAAPRDEVGGWVQFSKSNSPLVVARLAAFVNASARRQNKWPSYPAHAGYPVRGGFSIPAPASLEYWITRMR